MAFSPLANAFARSRSAMAAVSVISTVSRRGSPLVRSKALRSRSSISRSIERAERFTDSITSSRPARPQVAQQVGRLASTQRSMSAIRSKRSATGRKTPGETSSPVSERMRTSSS